MAVGIIIDSPDTLLGDTEQWSRFLAEMRRAKARANDIDTHIEIDRYIKLAERVLAERRITGT